MLVSVVKLVYGVFFYKIFNVFKMFNYKKEET